jgi:hypothetical protein
MPPTNEDTFPFPTRFQVHEEAVETQLAAESAALPPVTFEDHDQENAVVEEGSPDPYAGITVHTAQEVLNMRIATGQDPDWSEFICDGDEDQVINNSSDIDSIIGAQSPRRDITSHGDSDALLHDRIQRYLGTIATVDSFRFNNIGSSI